MDRRYQVFVSSTYADLMDERREVIQALLELDCIPAGMELFPAADDDQWQLIQQVIDDCDYYLVIVAGRYGSLHKDGLSFTEKEYRYALEKKKPIIGFVHHDTTKIPSGNVDLDPDKQAKLDSFVALVKQKPVRFWADAKELGSQISRSLIKLIKSHPSPGWVKADNLADETAAQEILTLRKEIDRLKREIEVTVHEQPQSARDLSQGSDRFAVSIDVIWDINMFDTVVEGFTVAMAWNEIVFAVGPALIDAATSSTVKNKLEQYIKDTRNFSQSPHANGAQSYEVKVAAGALDTVIVQLIAIGVLRKSSRNRSVKDTNTYWELTPYGEKLMYDVRAIPRGTDEQFSTEPPRGAE